MTTFKQFLRDDAGAVTIDWVALTAGILLLGIALVFGIFNQGVVPLADRIGSSLATAATDVNIPNAPDFSGDDGS